ncbi:hypothetical protein Y032_0079g1234 [Ancylostoma ceylanicum]|nr:hypothetical protein Y032_0079g1234 [Ancylostoma ceylanicum]
MTVNGCTGATATAKFVQFCKSNNLDQLVDKPTHGLNILDIVLTNNSSAVKDLSVIAPFSTSDHNVVCFSVDVKAFNPKEHYIPFRDFSKGDYSRIIDELLLVDWIELIHYSNSADECYSRYISICHALIRKYIPLVFPKQRIYALPRKLLSLRSKVAFFHRNIHIYGSSKYASTAAKLKRALALWTSAREERIARSSSSKKLFSYCNRKLKLTDEIPDLKDGDSLIHGDQQKANLFASYFEDVYRLPTKFNVELVPVTDKVIDWVDINCESVYRVLRALPNRNSTSPDGIPYAFLKNAALGLASPLSLIFNRFLLHGETPRIWKLGLVKPIHKKGPKGLVSNYRPICLTCSTSKVMERLICDQIGKFLSENRLLSNTQHGFQSKRSTSSALLSTVPLWHREVDRGNYVSVCYVDFKKAFDLISIPLLLQKLQSFGIKGCLHRFLTSFLTERNQSVVVNSAYSRTYPTVSGVPQGTCLGPLMFLLYINDLASVLPEGVHCSIFADDSKIYTISNASLLQQAIYALASWADKWELSISTEKTFVMGFGKNHPDMDFTLNGSVLVRAHEIRDLGVTYTDDFNFDRYIADITAKAKCRSNYILKAFKIRNPLLLFKLFTAYVRPLLEYCSSLWSPSRRREIDEIEKVQKSFTYRSFARKGMFELSYFSRLKKLGALTLEDRRLLSDLTFMYKLTTDEVKLDLEDLFEITPFVNLTRGHPFRIRPIRPRTTSFKNSFLCRVQTKWNTLDPGLFVYSKSSGFYQRLTTLLQSGNLDASYSRF